MIGFSGQASSTCVAVITNAFGLCFLCPASTELIESPVTTTYVKNTSSPTTTLDCTKTPCDDGLVCHRFALPDVRNNVWNNGSVTVGFGTSTSMVHICTELTMPPSTQGPRLLTSAQLSNSTGSAPAGTHTVVPTSSRTTFSSVQYTRTRTHARTQTSTHAHLSRDPAGLPSATATSTTVPAATATATAPVTTPSAFSLSQGPAALQWRPATFGRYQYIRARAAPADLVQTRVQAAPPFDLGVCAALRLLPCVHDNVLQLGRLVHFNYSSVQTLDC